MYEWLSQFSSWISGPFTALAYSSDIGLLTAFFLGMVGSVAPCQISANMGAVTYFSQRWIQEKISWLEIILFILGKTVVYTFFGILFWWFGKELSSHFIPLFIVARKLIGPLFIVIGLFLCGWLMLPGNIGFSLSERVKGWSNKVGRKGGAFVMGAAFSLGFCPTMFWLFFGILMPMVIQSNFGPILPTVFAVGTAIPLLLISGLYFGFGLDRWMIKRTKKWGSVIQKMAGVFFILWGMMDTYTYWTL